MVQANRNPRRPQNQGVYLEAGNRSTATFGNRSRSRRQVEIYSENTRRTASIRSPSLRRPSHGKPASRRPAPSAALPANSPTCTTSCRRTPFGSRPGGGPSGTKDGRLVSAAPSAKDPELEVTEKIQRTASTWHAVSTSQGLTNIYGKGVTPPDREKTCPSPATSPPHETFVEILPARL
jgi:hypothetical protein